jgi:hypothetical protein
MMQIAPGGLSVRPGAGTFETVSAEGDIEGDYIRGRFV